MVGVIYAGTVQAQHALLGRRLLIGFLNPEEEPEPF